MFGRSEVNGRKMQGKKKLITYIGQGKFAEFKIQPHNDIYS